MSTNSFIFSYGRKPPQFKFMCRILVLTLVAGGTGIAAHFVFERIRIYRQVTIDNRLVNECEQFAFPDHAFIYADQINHSDRSKISAGYNVDFITDKMAALVRYPPTCFNRLLNCPSLSNIVWFAGKHLVYMHAREIHTGHPVLVLLGTHVIRDANGSNVVLEINGVVVDEGSGGPSVLDDSDALFMQESQLGPFRIFAGVSDERDKSRFTLDYSLGDTSGTIECKLDLDNRLKFKAMSGPLQKK